PPRVLVVEDSATQTEAIRFLLEDAGFVVETAADGVEALELIGRQRPDAVATDLELPRMNGRELAEAVRRDYPAVPVVLITAHGNLEVTSELRQQDESVYHDTVRARREQPPYRDRRVRLRCELSPAEVAFVVRDEGPGFDPASLPDPTDPANLERIGGRGLLLIRTFMDEVRHNPSGNEITMLRRVERTA